MLLQSTNTHHGQQQQQLNLVSPSIQTRDSKISSLIESPMPPVTDPRPAGLAEKNVKDFSRQYLKEGMWPGKINHKASEYR